MITLSLRGCSNLLSEQFRRPSRPNEPSRHRLLLPHLAIMSLTKCPCLEDCQHQEGLQSSAEAIPLAVGQQKCHDQAPITASSQPT